jgi:integrase
MRTGKLTERKVRQRNNRGYLNDGGGLYLRVAKGGSKQWVYRFTVIGRLREMGLGPIATLSLEEAREKAREYRKLRLDGIDPIEQRRSYKGAARVNAARTMTFRQCAEAYLEAHWESWDLRTQKAWSGTLARYVYSVFGDMPVAAVGLDLILQVLEPIWKSKTATASRLRGRIESILDWAAVRKFRQGENPARWRGHLDQLLPQRGKLQKVEHFAALPFSEISSFMAELRQIAGPAARALELAILTAVRTKEVRGARWSEIDLAERVWTIPAERMTKTGREHRVPLSERALEILQEQQQVRESDLVFVSGRTGRPLGSTTLLKLLGHMGHRVTVHGFRSTFRDWAAEQTNFPRDACEMALAHVVGNQVEAAYRRGDLFRKRQQLMEVWARYCALPAKTGEKVVALRQAC